MRPKRAPLAVVTASGNLEGHRINGDGPAVIVVCPPESVERVRASLPEADVITVLGLRMTPADIIHALRSRGFDSILCEGGPGLARQMVVAGLADEVCLTTSPRLTGVTLPLFGVESFPEVAVELAQLLVDDESSLYARWITTGRASG